MNRIYEILPNLDDDGPYLPLQAIDDMPGVRGGVTVLSDFDPGPVTDRNWSAPRLAAIWKPLRVENLNPGQRNDYPCLGLTVPALSALAVYVLRDLLEPNGEILPLECEHGEFYAYNVTTVADVLDRERSDIELHAVDRLKIRKGISVDPVFVREIHKFVFKEPLLEDLSIFRLVDERVGYFVTQRFVDRVMEHDLKGFNFKLLWESGASAPTHPVA